MGSETAALRSIYWEVHKIMEYRKFGNTIIARIDKGEEILEQVKEIALKENIKLASIQALGAINDFTAGVFKTDEKNIIPTISPAVLRSSPSPGPSTPWTENFTVIYI